MESFLAGLICSEWTDLVFSDDFGLMIENAVIKVELDGFQPGTTFKVLIMQLLENGLVIISSQDPKFQIDKRLVWRF